MSLTRLTGHAAIHAAETLGFGVTLHKYADPTEGARDGLTVEEAREIAREDPSLIWCEAQPGARRSYPIAYALVLTSEDCPLTRYAHGLWPAGFGGCGHGDAAPRVVAVVVDSGAGRDAAGIQEALTVTYLDDAYCVTVNDAVAHHISAEMEKIAATV